MRWPWQTKQVETVTAAAVGPCHYCKDGGMVMIEKPMGFPPVMVGVPNFCGCPAGRRLAHATIPATTACPTCGKPL